MTTVKQEVAAILMDYTDGMTDQTYRDILAELGKIPEARDPHQVEEYQRRISNLEDTNTVLTETLDEREIEYEAMAYQFERLRHQTYVPVAHMPNWPDGYIPPERLAQIVRHRESGYNIPNQPLDFEREQFSRAYDELWRYSWSIRRDNDSLRQYRSQELDSAYRDLKLERRESARFQDKYLQLRARELGDVTLSGGRPELMGKYVLMKGAEANYCALYQREGTSVYLYNANIPGTEQREWVVADIESAEIYYRLLDNNDSVLPVDSRGWLERQGESSDWKVQPKLHLTFDRPYRKFQIHRWTLPEFSDGAALHRKPEPVNVWEEDCLGLGAMLS